MDSPEGSRCWINSTACTNHANTAYPGCDASVVEAARRALLKLDYAPFARRGEAVARQGPVAPSDPVGGTDVELVLKSCAADGKLLQPDRPATYPDAAIRSLAAEETTGVVLATPYDARFSVLALLTEAAETRT